MLSQVRVEVGLRLTRIREMELRGGVVTRSRVWTLPIECPPWHSWTLAKVARSSMLWTMRRTARFYGASIDALPGA